MEATLAKRIAANRKKLGLTQDQLAEKLGVTAQAVSKWENDQSCPDINMLPKLAEIFQISTDELLGHSHVHRVHTDPVVENIESTAAAGENDFEFNLTWDNHKYGSICFGIFVLAVGVLYLLSQILSWDLSFWDILWPTAVLSFGLFGLFRKFSFFNLGCTLIGGYFLCAKIFAIQLKMGSGVLFAILILLFGASLLVDAMRKKKRVRFNFPTKFHDKSNMDYDTSGNSFECNGSFCSFTQVVTMNLLERGSISNSFGEMTVDLSEVQAVGESCKLSATCSFGELKILVPRRYQVKPVNSTAFAEFHINGRPDENPVGQILLDISVSFGEATIIYI